MSASSCSNVTSMALAGRMWLRATEVRIHNDVAFLAAPLGPPRCGGRHLTLNVAQFLEHTQVLDDVGSGNPSHRGYVRQGMVSGCNGLNDSHIVARFIQLLVKQEGSVPQHHIGRSHGALSLTRSTSSIILRSYLVCNPSRGSNWA